MAPDKVDHTLLETQIKDIIQDLFNLMVQTASYDAAGPGVRSREVLTNTINQLSSSLQTLHGTASSPSLQTLMPPEIVTYVDQGRNPDIYTREFVELARRANQILKGKATAFEEFRDVFAQELVGAVPEMRADVENVVAKTKRPGAQENAALSGASAGS